MAFWLFSGGSTGLPEGRRAPAPRHPVHVRDLRARDPRRSARTTSRSPRPSSTTRTGWATTSRSRTGSARRPCCGPAGPDPKGLLRDGAGAAAERCSSPCPRSTARWSTCPTRREHDLSLGAHVRLRRRAARARGPAPLAEPLRPGHRRRHRLHRDAPHLLLQPARRRAPGHERQARAGLRAEAARRARARRSADGEVGNLHVRGDSALAYYWHQHEKTKAAIKGDWFFTGDRYRVDDNGDYVYEGRADDMIKIGGLWASPIEIENALVEHPRVLEAAAVGVEADYTTRVKAFVICRGDAGDDALVDRAAGVVQGPPAPLRVPALHRLRRRAAQDADGQDPALQAARMIFTALRTGGLRRASRPRCSTRSGAARPPRATASRSCSCSPRRTCSASAARPARSSPTRC